MKWYRKSLQVILLVLSWLIIASPSFAATVVNSYTADDGVKIVSFSETWGTEQELKAVYDELIQNTHGDELKLLKEVRLYSGTSRGDNSILGEWKCDLDEDNGKMDFKEKAVINLYQCDQADTVEKIAPVLSHEYGHHFTYFYYGKYEKKTWADWKNSKLAKARNLLNNQKVNADGSVYRWSIQEICADDYVQLFGSEKAKLGGDFQDINSAKEYNARSLLYFNIFNLRPQENYELPLAANLKDLRNYWEKASGITNGMPTKGTVPSLGLKLSEVKGVSEYLPSQYIFTWDKVEDASEYTLVMFEFSEDNTISAYPIKRVSAGGDRSAAYGSVKMGDEYYYQNLPEGAAYLVVYVRDKNNQMTSSNIMAIDFTYPLHPDTVLIDDDQLSNGNMRDIFVKVNDKQMKFDVEPTIIDGRVLVPLRAIFEEFGTEVNWDAATSTITAESYDTTIELQVGSKTAKLDGETIELDAAPTVINGRTMVPLRFISEALGAEVKWNKNLQLAKVNEY